MDLAQAQPQSDLRWTAALRCAELLNGEGLTSTAARVNGLAVHIVTTCQRLHPYSRLTAKAKPKTMHARTGGLQRPANLPRTAGRPCAWHWPLTEGGKEKSGRQEVAGCIQQTQAKPESDVIFNLPKAREIANRGAFKKNTDKMSKAEKREPL